MYEDYDGVLLIHPDWFKKFKIDTSSKISLIYSEMARTQEECNRLSMPFIVEPSKDEFTISEIGLDPNNLELILTNNPIDGIENIVEKPREDISLLIGGFYYCACVVDWMLRYCDEQIGIDQYTMKRYLEGGATPKNSDEPKLKSGTFYRPLTDRPVLFRESIAKFYKKHFGN